MHWMAVLTLMVYEHQPGPATSSEICFTLESRRSSGPADLSTRGGLRGCRLRCRADRLGRNFESILVHIESLLPVQAFDELTCRLTDRSRKTRRLHFDCRFRCSFISISIAKLHLKRFHAPTPFSDNKKTETGSRSKPRRDLKTAVPLAPTTFAIG